MKALYNDRVVEVLSVNGGWTTYRDHMGAERKDRNPKFNLDQVAVSAAEALQEAEKFQKTDTKADDFIFNCDRCNESFLSPEALKQHQDEHDNPPEPKRPLGLGVSLISKSNDETRARILARRAEEKAAAKEAQVKKMSKVRVTKSNISEIKTCPSCGSDEIRAGVIGEDGTVEHEDLMLACHKCDWSVDLREKQAKITPNMNNYVVGKGTTASGRATIDRDDVVARKLRGMDLEEIYRYVADVLFELNITTVGAGKNKTECGYGDLKDRYHHLNVGMQRMNLGNLLRGAMKRLNMENLPEV